MSDSSAGVGDGFLSRWSRLKSRPGSAAVAESLPVVAASAEPLAAKAQADEQALLPDDAVAMLEAEPLTDADMPDIDSLDEQSDLSGFFSEKVTEQLRRKALQRLFHLPAFNIRDGLNEYDDDYSSFAPLGDCVTYQMKAFIERQKQQFSAALQDDPVDADPVVAVADPGAESNPEQLEPCDEDELGVCE